jgi:UDP-2,3-diacylglucosamine pyrophosphatase LpxH
MLYRTVWMSDLHLGTRSSNAAGVLDFLKHNEFERLYLVGDVAAIHATPSDLADKSALLTATR